MIDLVTAAPDLFLAQYEAELELSARRAHLRRLALSSQPVKPKRGRMIRVLRAVMYLLAESEPHRRAPTAVAPPMSQPREIDPWRGRSRV